MDSFEFIKTLRTDFVEIREIPADITELKKTIIIEGQALYLMNYKERKISYTKGVQKLLGYTSKEFTMKLATSDFLHPKQKNVVSLLINSTIALAARGNVDIKNAKFNLLYKVKHKNGKYMDIFRQTGVFESDEDGRMASTYSLITDVTGLMDADKVKWSLSGSDSAFLHALEKEIIALNQSIFSTKEWEVIRLLKKGMSSKDIAAELNNSVHTIDTHRRKILKKANCLNTVELIHFLDNII